MVVTEIAKLGNRGCEKEGGAKDDDRRAHLETVKRRGRALPSQDPNAVDFALGFLKN